MVSPETESLIDALARVPGNRKKGRNCVEIADNDEWARLAALRQRPITSEQRRIVGRRIAAGRAEGEGARCPGKPSPR